jgi:hypothetical protein
MHQNKSAYDYIIGTLFFASFDSILSVATTTAPKRRALSSLAGAENGRADRLTDAYETSSANGRARRWLPSTYQDSLKLRLISL